ncbi:MAG: 4Fe-4S dicluster domain-containing protein [Deltaproteobacteria bacterium]|jgi:ferredoxin|nr:4Fe-4S dicluster domain-containing protein [Deltaproteobacteria bacterium]
MTEYIVKESNLTEFFQAVSQNRTLLSPVGQGEKCRLEPTTPDKIKLDFANTHLSPKASFFPQTERLLAFHKDKSLPNSNVYQDLGDKAQDCVLFGLRPCDAKGLTVANKVFQNDRFVDPYWKGKYEKALKIGLACLKPSPQCFCAAVGGSPFGEQGLDVLAYVKEGGLGLKTLTEAGEALIKSTKAESASLSNEIQKLEQEAYGLQKAEKDSYKVITERDLMEVYNDPHWPFTAENCLNCGVCTFFCPTCHCFDIQDEQSEKGGVRMRNWDTCMSSLFTLHASGHNPRPTKVERVRQRFMHKLKYIPIKQDGVFGCTGCGRCVVMCPVNIDIRDVAAKMCRPTQTAKV